MASSPWRKAPIEQREVARGADWAGLHCVRRETEAVAVSGDLREGHQGELSQGEVERDQDLDNHLIGSTGSDTESRGGDGVPVVPVGVSARGSFSQIPAVPAATRDNSGKRKGARGSLDARRERDLAVRAKPAVTERSADEYGAGERSGRASARVSARVVRHDSRGLGASALLPPGAGKARWAQPAAGGAGTGCGGCGNGDEEERIATAALMERFSFRERELLHELQTWKSRCENLKDNIVAGGSDEFGRGQVPRGDCTAARVHPQHSPPPNGRDACNANMPDGSAFPSPSLPSPAELCGRGMESIGPPASRGEKTLIPNESRAETLDSGQGNVGIYGGGADGREMDARHSAGGGVRRVLVLFDLPPEREGDLELKRQDVIEVSVAASIKYGIRTGGEGGGTHHHA